VGPLSGGKKSRTAAKDMAKSGCDRLCVAMRNFVVAEGSKSRRKMEPAQKDLFSSAKLEAPIQSDLIKAVLDDSQTSGAVKELQHQDDLRKTAMDAVLAPPIAIDICSLEGYSDTPMGGSISSLAEQGFQRQDDQRNAIGAVLESQIAIDNFPTKACIDAAMDGSPAPSSAAEEFKEQDDRTIAVIDAVLVPRVAFDMLPSKVSGEAAMGISRTSPALEVIQREDDQMIAEMDVILAPQIEGDFFPLKRSMAAEMDASVSLDAHLLFPPTSIEVATPRMPDIPDILPYPTHKTNGMSETTGDLLAHQKHEAKKNGAAKAEVSVESGTTKRIAKSNLRAAAIAFAVLFTWGLWVYHDGKAAVEQVKQVTTEARESAKQAKIQADKLRAEIIVLIVANQEDRTTFAAALKKERILMEKALREANRTASSARSAKIPRSRNGALN
jgi:hypothetical protein